MTEFLPVSSSAHLRVVAELAGWDDPGAAFSAVTQLGTGAVAAFVLRREIAAALAHPGSPTGWYVVAGTVPIGVLGLACRDAIETHARDLRLTAASLVGFGLVLAAVDDRARATKAIDQLDLRDAIGFGLAQALALVPGVSRSGGTISGGLALGYRRADAARFALLLSVPAVGAAGLFELRGIGRDDDAPTWPQTLVATLVAAGAGAAVLRWFLRRLDAGTLRLRPFARYRVALGSGVAVLAAVRQRARP